MRCAEEGLEDLHIRIDKAAKGIVVRTSGKRARVLVEVPVEI